MQENELKFQMKQKPKQNNKLRCPENEKKNSNTKLK